MTLTALADPPGVAAGALADGQLARACWQAAAAAIAGDGRMILSGDGGRTYPRRPGHTRPLTAGPPPQPAAVHVYNPQAGTGRLLAADFDIKKARDAGAADPARAVARDAAAFTALITAAGGHCLQDVSPGGGRHVYVLWAQPRPWRELRQLAAAAARRYPSLDTSPHNALTGLIRPPGSRYRLVSGRSPGWQQLITPLPAAARIIAAPCGPATWNALHQSLAPELAALTASSPDPGTAANHTGLPPDRNGDPWLPRTPSSLPPAIETIARTGHYGPRYPSGSEARMAVLCSAANRGWQLSQITHAITSGTWPGLARLYQRYSPSSRTRALERDWRKAIRLAAGEKNTPRSHTRQNYSHPPDGDTGKRAPGTVHERIWEWRNAVWLAERHRKQEWGGAAASIRLTLRALAAAMQMTGSLEAEFGIRDLALNSKISARAVAEALARLRSEPDPLIIRTRQGRGLRADRYRARIPASYQAELRWYRWRTGIIPPVHPVFRILGPSAVFTWEALTAEPATATAVAGRAALGTAAAGRALRVLAEHGLAARGRGGWRRGPSTLDDAARATGAYTAEEETRKAYARDREHWRIRLTRPELPDDPAGTWEAPVTVPGPRPGPWPQPAPSRGPPPPDDMPAALALLENILGAKVLAG